MNTAPNNPVAALVWILARQIVEEARQAAQADASQNAKDSGTLADLPERPLT